MKKTLLLLCIVFLAAWPLSIRAQDTSKPNPKALDAMKKNDFRGAIGILDSDIAAGKNLLESYKLRSTLRKAVGDFSGAFTDLNKAIEIKPTDGPLYHQRSELRLVLRQPSNLILEDLDLAISYGVKHEKVFVSRGSIRRDLGDADGSISDYKQAIGLRPGYALANVGLASAYRKKGDEEASAKVLEAFIAAVENEEKKVRSLKGVVAASETVESPLSGGATRESTTLLVGQGVRLDHTPSVEEMEEIGDRMEQAKNTAAAYANLAFYYEKRKDLVKALALSDKGIKIDPNDFYGLGIRGIIKLDMGDFQGAVSDYDRAIRITPRNGSFYLNRGIAYLLQNKKEESQRDFDKYLELNPNGKDFLDRQVEYAKKLHEK